MARLLCEHRRGDPLVRKTEHDPAGLELIDRAIPAEERIPQPNVTLEVATRARAIGVAPRAQRRSVDVRHDVNVRKRVAPFRERPARRVPVHCPVEVGGLARLKERPHEVQLEGIGVDDDESVAGLALEHIVPSRDIALEPERRGRMRVGRNARVIREGFQ